MGFEKYGVTMQLHGTEKVLKFKSKLLESFGYGKDAEYAEAIFEYALQQIDKNKGIGLGLYDYEEFVRRGSILSFWYQGVNYEYKNSKVIVYNDFSSLND
jgi:hypothetical protein